MKSVNAPENRAYKRVIYYSDELNDDFAGTKISTNTVDHTFPFVHKNPFWNACAFVLYYVVALPLVYLAAKLYLGLKFENRRALKGLRKSGFYLYGNHTQQLDAFVPALAAFPKRAYIVANADAVSIPFLRNIVMMLGAIPVPTSPSGLRGFTKALSTRISQKRCVTEFPERHIWPFYTGIRPFPDNSFHHPIRDNVPLVAMVTTYRRRRGLLAWVKRPAMTVTFSEPILPPAGLSVQAAKTELRSTTAKAELRSTTAKAELRDKVYAFMKAHAGAADNVEYYHYVKR